MSLISPSYFRRYMNIYFEFIPQVLFLGCIFGTNTVSVISWMCRAAGYLVFIIFYKWNHDWTGQSAPSLLITLINMFLSFGSKPGDGQVIYGDAVCGFAC